MEDHDSWMYLRAFSPRPTADHEKSDVGRSDPGKLQLSSQAEAQAACSKLKESSQASCRGVCTVSAIMERGKLVSIDLSLSHPFESFSS